MTPTQRKVKLGERGRETSSARLLEPAMPEAVIPQWTLLLMVASLSWLSITCG